MVSVEEYTGSNGQTRVKEEKNYPERQWLDFPKDKSTKVSGIVLESAYLDRNTKYGEAIYVFGHDGMTGELVAFTIGVSVNQYGKRGTVWSRTAVETLLDTTFGANDRTDLLAIDSPTIKDIFKDKLIWIGKTQVGGKNYNAFECDFMEGTPVYDSSYTGVEDDDEPKSTGSTSEDKPEFDMSDDVNAFIFNKLIDGMDALDVVKEASGEFPSVTKPEIIKKVTGIKKTMDE